MLPSFLPPGMVDLFRLNSVLKVQVLAVKFPPSNHRTPTISKGGTSGGVGSPPMSRCTLLPLLEATTHQLFKNSVFFGPPELLANIPAYQPRWCETLTTWTQQKPLQAKVFSFVFGPGFLPWAIVQGQLSHTPLLSLVIQATTTRAASVAALQFRLSQLWSTSFDLFLSV